MSRVDTGLQVASPHKEQWQYEWLRNACQLAGDIGRESAGEMHLGLNALSRLIPDAAKRQAFIAGDEEKFFE